MQWKLCTRLIKTSCPRPTSFSISFLPSTMSTAADSQTALAPASQPVKLSLPLKYQQEIFQSVRAEDSLVILARGLGLLRLVSNLLHSYDAAGNNLMLILGLSARESAYLSRALIEAKVTSAAAKARGLTCITAKETPKARQELYARGGLFSVTARILIGDVLSGVVKVDQVTGIVAVHAERFTATSNEAFILRVYRDKNRTGFLKAFSENPEAFTRGFNKLGKMLQALFLKKVSLWPRYHVSVAQSLEGTKKAEVIELEVPLTPAMADIQNAIRECVNQCITEVRKTNSGLGLGLDFEEWDVSKGGLESFDVMIRRQLEPNWHRLSSKTRRIVGDLSVLRGLLSHVLEYDAVSFLRHLDYVHETYMPNPANPRSQESPWMFLDAAQVIFEAAKRRVYAAERLTVRNNDLSEIEHLVPVLEELPKWDTLADVLEEIDQEATAPGPSRDDSNACVLVMVRASETCRQLRDYLQTMHISPTESQGRKKTDQELDSRSGEFMMRRKLRRYLADNKAFSVKKAALYSDTAKSIVRAVDLTTGTTQGGARGGFSGRGGRGGGSAANNRRRVRGGAAVGSAPAAVRTPSGAIAQVAESPAQVGSLIIATSSAPHAADARIEIVDDDFSDMDGHYGLLPMSSMVVVHAYGPDGDGDDVLLETIKPRYIVMYDVDAAFIRRIEVYRSSHNDRDVRSYFLYYAGSVEEEAYLSTVRREKDAFTALIRARAGMALTLDVEKPVKSKDGIDVEEFLGTVNTRIAGGGRLGNQSKQPRVVVDIREFRSSLPPLLHGVGMAVVPAQLTVGDYIISPRICVERKAIADLIQSLASGRLYSQCEAMQRHYEAPVLLIEFDQGKSFTLERFADMGHGHSPYAGMTPGADLQGKIVALTIAFPGLRVVWSSSPHETADIFQSLKSMENEPEPREAVDKGVLTGEKETEGGLEPVLQSMVLAVPGVTEGNLGLVTRVAGSLKELANMKMDELTRAVGPEAAGRIHYFFNRNLAH